MREVGDRYTALPEGPAPLLERDGLSVLRRDDLFQTLIGGDLEAARGVIGVTGPSAGLYEIVAGDSATVRIGRDRMLLVGEKVPAATEGWHEAGWAATRMDDAYAVLEISGDAMPALVREGTGADFESGSPSAAIFFAGCWTLLYRTAPATARLHLEAFMLPYMACWLAK